MVNRYAGDCNECNTYVEAGTGQVTRDGDAWITICQECFDQVEQIISITLHPKKSGQAIVKPVSHLGDALFHEYRQACLEAGTKYNSTLKANLVKLESLPRLTKELKACGFSVSVSDQIVSALDEMVVAANSDSRSADERIDAINAELAQRNESLFGYQIEGIRWLSPRRTALLADDMGLGKSVQALMSVPDGSPILVVCPAVAKGVWLREAKRWRPDLKGVTLVGRNSFRWPKPGEMVITNYDILPDLDKKDIRKSVHAGCPENVVIVADEAQALKNNKAKRTKRFRSLGKYALNSDGKVWLLTATPMLNRPVELWNILQAADLASEAFSNWEKFVELFSGEKGRWGGYEWGEPTKKAAKFLRRVCLRREKRDVLPDLPSKIYSTLDVEIDKKTQTLCDSILESIQAAGVNLDAAVDAASDAALRGSVAFEEISAVRASLATAKIPSLLKLVEDYESSDTPVVVFSAHRSPIDIFSDRQGWAVITGDTSPKKRTQVEDDFQAGKLKGVAATIQAGGTAITLTHASNMIFVDLDWTPALNAQAEDRCCRIGQNFSVQVTRLAANHKLDQSVVQLLAKKQAIISGSVERSRQTTVKSTRADELQDGLNQINQLATEAAKEAEERQAKEEEAASKRLQTPQKPPKKKVPAGRREAKNGAERWAEQSVLQLAAADPDRASARNHVGFNGADGAFGHSLAAQLAGGAGLTDKQWRAAIKLCRKYHRQVGDPPDAEAVA